MDALTKRDYRIISNHSIAEVRQQLLSNQKKLIALKGFKEGEIISLFTAGTTSAAPTYLTVQIDTDKHITLQPEFLQYINHSCSPNVFFNTTTMQLVALKSIKPEEEMTFFYPSTEWKMAQSFHCYCGNKNCISEITGAAFLSPQIISQYRFTDFILQQLAIDAARKNVA